MSGTSLSVNDARARISARYRHFAEMEAVDRSPLYVELAAAVADTPWLQDFLAAMPESKRQPNLLFGVVRYLYGTPDGGPAFLRVVKRHADDIARTMATRSTQTNEPARCATLLPVLAQLPQPLALLEVGASAGLCLLPDYYECDYLTRRIPPTASADVPSPRFTCRAGPGTPLPDHNVQVAWRAGLDVRPIDLNDDAEVAWLEALVWPGMEYRLPGLRAACEVARAVRPEIVTGDLRTDLPALAARAPGDATLVVFHTAVLAYVPPEGRQAFAAAVAETGAVWVANEGPRLIPGVPDLTSERPGGNAFLLCVDRRPTAWTDGHAQWVQWRRSPPSAMIEREWPDV